ncbi:MAG: dUTP diphosphatase [Ruminococcaceae bacterium]|nr:dUTP diphosphatase [Oscillospiraceae bacterium]
MEIKIKKLRENAKVPQRGTSAAAGADLYACFDGGWIDIAPGDTVMVPTGIAAEIPDGYAGLIMARSGLSVKRDLAPANKVGLIDSDYRGEIMVALHNHGALQQTVELHERVAQLMIVPYVKADYVEVDELSDTVRGEGGFGSTGTK